jgi:UDP-N-acetylglucosamine acyltransferase
MTTIDPTARVENGAVIGEGATVGPYCVIGRDVRIGANCKLISHVHVMGHTTIGAGCSIYPFASLGGAPQSLGYRGEPTKLEIGDGCTIRESVTMSTGTVGGGGTTRVGDRGYFMNCSHVGHDCQVGNDVIFATSATLGGHCEIGDFVFIGGLSAVHQFTRIGQQAMIGGVCGVRGDVIPYGLVNGQYARLEGLNIVGMKRRKFTRERLAAVRSFYQKLFESAGVFSERLDAARALAVTDPAVAEILTFIDAGQHRPLCLPSSRTGENG